MNSRLRRHGSGGKRGAARHKTGKTEEAPQEKGKRQIRMHRRREKNEEENRKTHAQKN